MTVATTAPTRDADLTALRRAGNPFRNYFARNPDDEVCARFHVPELYAAERALLWSVVDLYRYDPLTHSEVLPVLGNKGAGKTHLLHSIKHGGDGAWQMLVTPAVYQKDTDFLEYLLFQVIETMLGGSKQRGVRPLGFVSDQLTRRLLGHALRELTPAEKLAAFPPTGLGKWGRRLGMGSAQADERCKWLAEAVHGYASLGRPTAPLAQALLEAGLEPDVALAMVAKWVEKVEPHSAAGQMRKAISTGLARASLLGDEGPLAEFLTFGFAELEFHVRPTRQDLVLSLLKALMETFRTLKIPVVVAFDQLEDLLLARRSDDAHKVAEAFFAGVVQVMHQIDGVCILVFAERGLWNRFVPSLDGYIQDRLNNPVHVPQHGTVKALRLEAPPLELVRRVVETRLAPSLAEMPGRGNVGPCYPFTDEQIERVAATEPTLRDMLQQFRHMFDRLVYDAEEIVMCETPAPTMAEVEVRPLATDSRDEIRLDGDTFRVTSAEVVEVSAEMPTEDELELPAPIAARVSPIQVEAASALTHDNLKDLWLQEVRAAKRRLEPDGALVPAAREIQAGLGSFLQAALEHGVKVGPWRLNHVVPEFSFSEHPTYGVMAIAHWASKDGSPWKVGVGLYLARGAAKPKELEVKLSAMNAEPALIDHLILLRPEDDTALTGKSKTLWQEAEKKGRSARIEAVSLEAFAAALSFPRWLSALGEALPEGRPLPNLADTMQDVAEKLLEQVCMPTTG